MSQVKTFVISTIYGYDQHTKTENIDSNFAFYVPITIIQTHSHS